MVIPTTESNRFSPNHIITGAELADIIARGLGIQNEKGNNIFSDGSIRQNEAITREKAMVMIWRALEITDLKQGFSADANTEAFHQYSDTGKVVKFGQRRGNILLK